ncbi:ribosome silencing factor [Exiguobacterium sp. SH3S1]|uniref:ribosome silencing factor n=1 Tax=Exiguobacterium sp. SH3S1 TaxID=2510955 RepID=UPI0003530E02|nr:ribosome silencing factor [Exiguobacterium sp. SH3S1]EPE63218.1 iojap-like protein [Exiguobacterium sp. S17]TCI66456.1 ribosome silencing factor [Exiguobacterium sp. SH3S1]
MTIKEELELIVKAVDDKRGEDIVVLDMEGISPIADYFVICHGNSEKQVEAIAREIKDVAGENDLPLKKFEGMDSARWVLADLENVVVHIFHRDDRDYYNLEKLWADAPHVDVEVG